MLPILARGLAVLAAALLGAGCRDETPPPRPHLVLVAIDNLRADHVGAYGYPRPTTPHLDALARDGVRFANATASASWTKPSVASLFTSRWPSEHGAVSFERPIASEIPTLAEALRGAGYTTAGVSGNFVHIRSDMGFDRDAERAPAVEAAVEEGDPDRLWSQPGGGSARAPSGEELTRFALAEVPIRPERPFFLYVHYMDPHVPWAPKAERWRPFASGGAAVPEAVGSEYLVRLAAERPAVDPRERQRLVDLYDAEIAAVDAALGDLVAGLRERGVCGPCVLVVTADHGEEFGEHGGWFHGSTLHRESLAVPLVVRDFREAAAGTTRPEAVDLLDVAPTLLALAGALPPAGMRGRPLLAGALAERTLVAELHPDPSFESAVAPRAQRLALLRWPWKVIAAREGEAVAYRVDRDPGESVPAGGAPSDLVSRETLQRWLAELALPASRGVALSPEDREALRALGYVR